MTIRRDGGDALVLGGSRASAWVDDTVHGAVTPSGTTGQALAIVSGEPVRAKLDGVFTDSEGAPVDAPGGYQHLKCGFFFGDMVTTEGAREHMHLGTYVAGPPLAVGDLDRARGSATYSGHAMGDVYDEGAVRTVVGRFTDTFDFDQRTGSVRLDFHGTRYDSTSRLDGAAYRATLSSDDRSGRLDGRFTGPMRGDVPAGLVGRFQIQNQEIEPTEAYRAIGVFGGEVKR